MRSSTVSTLAFLATSLLVKDVIAGRFDVRKRQNYIIQVEEEVVVSKGPDGKYTTGKPIAVKTVTVPASAPTPVVETPTKEDPPVVVVSSSSVKAVAQPTQQAPKPSSTSNVAEAPKPTTTPPKVEAPKPTTTTPPKVEAPKPTSEVAKPTTLETSVTPVPSSDANIATTGAKRGAAYNDISLVKAFGGSISWAYNWGSGSGGALPAGVEYVPILWGDQPDKTNSWTANVEKALAAGSKHILGFNEPDLGEQAHMTVDASVTAWKKYIQPYAGKAKLGSPSVTNGDNKAAPYMGIPYLKQFISSCSGCTIDFVVIHWYNNNPLDSAVEYFKNHIKEAHDASGGKPVWLTEFQYTGGDQVGFLKKVIPWLEAKEQSYVERYSYFMASEGKLINGGGLSDIGKAYVA